jgi:hypothetical protein
VPGGFDVIKILSKPSGTSSPSSGGKNGMFTTGDLKPQSSGSASVGANQTGFTGFGTPPVPYNHVHMNSGVWHHELWGQSGVIRIGPRVDESYNETHEAFREQHLAGDQTLFELSVDGGRVFPLRLGASNDLYFDDLSEEADAGLHPAAIIRTQNYERDDLHIISSGTTFMTTGRAFQVVAFNPRRTSHEDTDTILLNATSGTLRTIGGTASHGSLSTITLGAGTDIKLTPNADGWSNYILHHRSGTGAFPDDHDTWYMRNLFDGTTGGPIGNGEWPIAHSGNVSEMIQRAIDGVGGGTKSKAITIERPAVNNDLTIWFTDEEITISEIESVLRGDFDASGQFAIRHSTDRSLAGTEVTAEAITCTSRSTGEITTSFASATIPANSWIWIGVSGVSGVSTQQLGVTIQYS